MSSSTKCIQLYTWLPLNLSTYHRRLDGRVSKWTCRKSRELLLKLLGNPVCVPELMPQSLVGWRAGIQPPTIVCQCCSHFPLICTHNAVHCCGHACSHLTARGQERRIIILQTGTRQTLNSTKCLQISLHKKVNTIYGVCGRDEHGPLQSIAITISHEWYIV